MGKPSPKRGDTQKLGAMVPTLQAQFDRILVVIADTKAALQKDIGVVSTGLGLLRAKHHKLVNRLKEVETGLREIKLSQLDLKRQVEELDGRLQTLESRAQGTEGFHLRNNVCVVGLPEGTELVIVV
ncbi:hypothetical protein NDU88_003001 [Pleurodeles waltl]|uniref:Uncharacterized protein n=1 Tax=Pleurodeles waltl TaxID=8319 RepID=A0AAV7PGY3_PLEWA|nr:hypothetical protein NDU88_003001 [Pleurodeles waltl]